jgi:hypothetical protein
MYVNPHNRIDRAASLAFACDAALRSPRRCRPASWPHDQARAKLSLRVARINPLGELAARGIRLTSRRT